MVEYHLLQLEMKKPTNSYDKIGPELIFEQIRVDYPDGGGAICFDDTEVPPKLYR